MLMGKMWGGFTDNKLDFRIVDDGWGGWGQRRRTMPALFTNRREARRQYEDVRRIELEEVMYMPRRKRRPDQ